MALTKVTYSMIDSSIINVKDFGADPTGVNDSTLAITAAAAALQNGQTLDFDGGTYLVSYQGNPYASVHGNIIMNFVGRSDIQFLGNNATIKIINHNITTYGGLMFMQFASCKRVTISGFNFDLSFVGANSSASFYPFVGAILASDEDAVSPNFSTLNSDFQVKNCSFKCFHPWGNWATTTTPYLGDPNNGYKLYSIFVSGPFSSTQYDNQSRNLLVENCIFVKGHNGYGIWIWAWNNCSIKNCIAEAWVSKVSTNTGVFVSGGLPMIRHTPFTTEGIIIEGNELRALPTAERTGDFAGTSGFYVQANNLTSASLAKGLTIVSNNNVILGNGAITGTGEDFDNFIYFNGYGQLIISNNNIDGHDTQNPAIGQGSLAMYIIPAGFSGANNGVANIVIDNNIMGSWMLGGGIFLTNGNEVSAASRRIKSLTITNNTQLSGDYFLRMTKGSAYTYDGVANVVISGNIIDSQNVSKVPPPSAENYGIFVAATEATDVVVMTDNIIKNRTYGIVTTPTFVSPSAQIIRLNNELIGNVANYAPGNVPNQRIDVARGVIVESYSDNNADEPRVNCINASATPAQVNFYQQQINSFIQATNKIIFQTDAASQVEIDNNSLAPASDNTHNFGNASFRWANIYAANGSIITTSDERQKQQIKNIDAAVLKAWGKVNYKSFKFNDAVNKKGNAARWHIGVIAQQVKDAFESEGLDAFEYGLLCYDEWEDQLKDEFVEVEEMLKNGKTIKKNKTTGEMVVAVPAGNRYSVRYEELLALECAYLRSKLQ